LKVRGRNELLQLLEFNKELKPEKRIRKLRRTFEDILDNEDIDLEVLGEIDTSIIAIQRYLERVYRNTDISSLKLTDEDIEIMRMLKS